MTVDSKEGISGAFGGAETPLSAAQGEVCMGLTQSLGKININTKKGMSVEVRQQDQNTYLFPDICTDRVDRYHYSYMGSDQKMEFNKYSELISELPQIEF